MSPTTPKLPDAGGGLAAGRVGRAHGLDGSFYVTAPRPRLLELGSTVSVAGEPREVVRRSGTDRRPILRLAGIDDRTAVERLRGLDITLDERDAPVLEQGEWWGHELEGCDVADARAPVGRVIRMIELPSCEALEVQPHDGGAPLLIPMVKDAIRTLDVEGRRVDVDLSFLGIDPPEAAPSAHGASPLEGNDDR